MDSKLDQNSSLYFDLEYDVLLISRWEQIWSCIDIKLLVKFDAYDISIAEQIYFKNQNWIKRNFGIKLESKSDQIRKKCSLGIC